MSDAGSYWRNWAGIDLAISRQSMTVHSQLRPNTYYRWHFLSLLPSLVWFLLSMLCTFFLLLLRSTVPTWRAIKENEIINVRMCVKGRNYFMIYGDLKVFLSLLLKLTAPIAFFTVQFNSAYFLYTSCIHLDTER